MYVYDYNVLVLGGISDIGNQYSAFGLKSEVAVQALNDVEIIIQIRNVTIAKERAILPDRSPDSVKLKFEQNAFYDNLTKAFIIEFKDGKIEKYLFDQSDPDWSRELKIGLGGIFEVRKQTAEDDEITNHLRGKEVSSMKQIMEPTYIGYCMSLYNYQNIKSDKSSSSDQIHITKIRDSQNCIHKPYFASSTHRPFQCDDCEADDSHPLSSNVIYKYVVDTDISGDYIIRDVVVDGTVRFAPLGQNADAIIIRHNRTLKFKRQSSMSPAQLRFNWTDESPYSNLINKTNVIFNYLQHNSPSISDLMVEKVYHLIERAIGLLQTPPSTEKLKYLLSCTLLIQRALATMAFDDLKAAAIKFGEKPGNKTNYENNRKLFWDSIAFTATNPAISLVIWASQNYLLSTKETLKILPVLASHAFTPNRFTADQLLKYCEDTIHSASAEPTEAYKITAEGVTKNELVASCYLSVGNLIAKTCADNEYEIPKNQQNYCEKSKRLHYVLSFKSALENTDDETLKLALITALGSTALPEVIDVIEPYIRAKDDLSLLVQTTAIYALFPLAKVDPEIVRQILSTVVFNAGENQDARIAAFDVLIATRPSRHLYEKIALFTKYEDDKTLNAYIYQALQALTNTTNPCLADASTHAAHALKLMDKECDTSDWIAHVSIHEGTRKYVDVDSFIRFVSIGDVGALAPRKIHLQLDQLISNFRSTLFSLDVQANNTGYLLETLMGGAAVLQDKPLKDRIQSLGYQIENMGLEKLAHKIGYLARSQPEFSAFVSSKFMDFEQQVQRINKDLLLTLFHKASGETRNEMLEIKYNDQKTMMPLDIFLAVPIECGLNVHIAVKVPVHLSMNLDLQVGYSPENTTENFNVDLRLQTTIAMKISVTAGVFIPDKFELIGAGYDTDIIAAPLIATKANIQLSNSRIEIEVNPVEYPLPEYYEIMRFETHPYTLIDPLLRFRSRAQNSEFIHTDKSTNKVINLFADTFTLSINDEMCWNDRGSLFNYITENSYLGTSTLWWATQQWVNRDYKLLWKTNKFPQGSLLFEWTYKPASRPDNWLPSFIFVMWRKLFGLADLPDECLYKSTNDDMHSFNWSNLEKAERNSQEYSGNPKSQSQDYYDDHYDFDSKPNFDIFEKNSSNGRWPGWIMINNDDDNPHRYNWKVNRLATRRANKSQLNEHERKAAARPYKIINKLSTLNLYVEGKLTGSIKRGYKANIFVKDYPKSLMSIYDVKINPLEHTPGPAMMCLRCVHTKEKPPCFFGKSFPDMSKANISSTTTLAWGDDCKNPDGYVEIIMQAMKSKKQLNLPASEHPWFYHQCHEDRLNGHYLSYACMKTTDDLSLLKHFFALIKYDNIPPFLVNFTQQLQDFSVYSLYPYVNHDFHVTENKEKQIELSVNFHYNDPAMDVIVKRPNETLQFNNVPFNKYSSSLFVPSVANSHYKRLLEEITDGTITPTCTITNRYVTTFSNHTYSFVQRKTCEYLVAGDCSSSNIFSVSFKNNSENGEKAQKVLIINFLKNVIEINPSDGKKDVVINGNSQVSTIDDTIVLSDRNYGPFLIGYLVKALPLYKFTMPFNRLSLIFNGEDIKLRTSNLWRNDLCGLCGRRHPEDDEPFMGADKCVYKSGNDFAQSYTFPSSSCPKPPIPRDVECSVESSYRHVANKDSCYQERNFVQKFKGGKICVTEKEHILCKESCIPVETVLKNVNFFCVMENNSTAESGESWINMLTFGLSTRPDFKTAIELPKKCVTRG